MLTFAIILVCVGCGCGAAAGLIASTQIDLPGSQPHDGLPSIKA